MFKDQTKDKKNYEIQPNNIWEIDKERIVFLELLAGDNYCPYDQKVHKGLWKITMSHPTTCSVNYNLNHIKQ